MQVLPNVPKLPRYTIPRRNTPYGRVYMFNNQDLYGITSVLSFTKPAKEKAILANWSKKNPGAKDYAANRGTEVHGRIEGFFENSNWEKPKPTIDSPPKNKVKVDEQEIQEFINPKLQDVVSKVTPLLIEGSVYHPLHRYCGTVDCVGLYEGELMIIDWKTSSKYKKPEWITDYFLQVAAYCAAVNRIYGLSINQGKIVIALKNDCQVFDVRKDEMMNYWDDFKVRLDQYKQMLAGKIGDVA